MTDTIYLLDFRRGIVVEKIDNSIPPQGAFAPTPDAREPNPRPGYVLTAAGSPPEADTE